MTFLGTNTYLVGEGDVAVIDPGPDDPWHLQAVLAALAPGERISHIFVTHAHRDHSPLARRLSQLVDAPVLAFGDALAGRSRMMQALARDPRIGGGEGVDETFRPDETLRDGEEIAGQSWSIRALWTPGHFGNHLCFQWEDRIFSGDHVMGWSTSLVSPPDGDMADYMRSLDRLQTAGAQILYPGHGAPIANPDARLTTLAAHRRDREARILEALDETPRDLAKLREVVYPDVTQSLAPAAERNLLAHLLDLTTRGLARAEGALSHSSRFLRP